MDYNFDRFIVAHAHTYPSALSLLQKGRKDSSWIFCIFPAVNGFSDNAASMFYSLSGVEEVTAYLAFPELGEHLETATKTILTYKDFRTFWMRSSEENGVRDR